MNYVLNGPAERAVANNPFPPDKPTGEAVSINSLVTSITIVLVVAAVVCLILEIRKKDQDTPGKEIRH